MSDERFVHAWLLGIDPAWRRRTAEERRADVDLFVQAAARANDRLTQFAYSTIGLRAEGDLLLWRMADCIEAIEETAAELRASGIGRWMVPAVNLIGLTRPSQYVKRPTTQEQSLFSGDRSRYLVVYPFTKSTEWYLSPSEERQAVMRDHMRIGHSYPQIRQLLAYSFGLDDQDFVVAYETDDLVAFQDLVRELRSSESRRATVRDTPIVTGIHRGLGDILAAISGTDR